MLNIYSLDDQYKYGVVAIAFSIEKRPNKVDEYIERFDESPFQTVAEYVVAKVTERMDEKNAQAGEKDILVELRNINHVRGKLHTVFREDVIVLMAYYIKYLEKEMDEAEFEKKVSSEYEKRNLEWLLYCACNLKYPFIRHKVFRHYVESE